MSTKTFNRYNFVTGAVDGTLAYDFGGPAYFPEEEAYEPPRKQKPETASRTWIKEETREKVKHAVHSRQGVSPLALLGAAAVVVLLVMTLLAQIRLMNISQTAVDLENQISALEAERDKLTVEYEAVFNLKDVEEYAVGVLGMQEPREDQIYFLSSVASADKAVVVTNTGTDVFSLGLEDLVASVKAYFN
jgi:hypothetical protein